MDDRDKRRQPPPYTDETIVMRPEDRQPSRPPATPPPSRPPRPPALPPGPPGPPSPARAPGQRARPRRRPSIWGRVRLALLLLALGLVALIVAFYWQVSSVARAIVVDDPRGMPPIASPLVGGANVLVVGVDERPDHPEEGVRSDTLILTRLDTIAGWAAMLSIPRDSQVSLLDIGPTKINVAYGQGYARAAELYGPEATPQEGGMALAAQTVEGFLGLPELGQRVDYVVQINFDGFRGIIDAIGGVEIDVPVYILDTEYPTPDFGYTTVEFQPGRQLMDGERALIYARTRHADSDFGRAQRQQQVISAIVAKLRSMGGLGRITALPGIMASVAGSDGAPPAVRTTMPIDRLDILLGILGLAGSIDPSTVGRFAINPQTVPIYSEVGSDLIWDQAGVQGVVRRFLRPPTLADEAALVQVLNGTGVSGLAGEATDTIEAAGFTVLPADNAPPGDYPRTLVYNLGDKPLSAADLARRLGGEVAAGPPPYATSADVLVILGEDAAP